jgi:uncharacterized membrane protein
MLGALVYVLVIMVFAALLYWVCDAIPVQQPLNRWVKIAIVVIAAIALISVLLNLGGIRIPT